MYGSLNCELIARHNRKFDVPIAHYLLWHDGSRLFYDQLAKC
jgi:hypothetical protein